MICPVCGEITGNTYIRRFVPSHGDKRGYYIRKCVCGWQKWTPHKIYLCETTVLSNKKVQEFV